MRRMTLLLCWLLTDAVLFVGAYVVAYFVRVGFIVSTNFPLNLYVQAVLIVAPIWIAVLVQLGVYRLTRIQSEAKNLAHLLFACVMGMSVFTLVYYFLFGFFFSRLLLVEAGAFSFVFAVIGHLAFDQWQRRILRRDPPAYPLLVIGVNRESERFITLLNDRQSPFKPVAVLDSAGSPKKDVAGVPVLGKLNVLEDVIKAKRPTHLVQCGNLEHVINLMSVCRQHRMTYVLLPSVVGAAVSGTSDHMEGYPVIMVSE